MSCLDLDDAECRKIAEPMMDDAMAGVLRRDFALHTRHFSVALKSTLEADDFFASLDRHQDDRGAPGTRELVCIFRKPRSFTLIWHQSFERSQGETLALATIALKGGRYFIDHFLLH